MKLFNWGWCAGGALLALTGLAAEKEVPDDDLRIRGIFNSNLPGTEKKHSLRFIFHPHLGDLINEDYLRTPMGARYGITQQWEVSGEVETYFSHGLGDEKFFDRFGFSQVRFGTKYRFAKPLFADWETATGMDFSSPVGSPPAKVNDGLEHLMPFVTFARPLDGHPNVRVFWGLGADLVDRSSVPGQLRKNQLSDDSLNLTTGVVWKRGIMNYTLETNYATTRGIGQVDEDVFTVRPGFVWEVPEKYTKGYLGGRWLVGLGLRASFGEDGTDLGASAKVRVNFDFKKLLRRKK
ncbi:hypothetical protein [Oleiharenicola lentus]|uniref:hypothetical protein n=1 Tax=Oleiharenicola lentus TaxID=2508720 RepID=UPI003F681B8D